MKQWYALRSKPKKEASAGALLARADVEVYVPRVRAPRRGGPPAWEAFFPGYLFGRLDPDRGELRLARYTRGVQAVLGYGGEPWPVPEALVREIRARLEGGGAPAAALRPGDRVVVAGGPLAGVEAVFDRALSGGGRVLVLIRLLERLCPAEIHVGQLRRPG